MFCEDLDEWWPTKDIWVVLITKSLNVWGTGITSYVKLLIFELLSLLSKHRLSQVVLCEDLDDCLQTEDIWYGLMTGLLNGGEIYITGNDNFLTFEWQSLRLNRRFSQGFIFCLPWLFHVPLVWQLPIPLGRGMMNTISVCCEIVCILFCLLMAIKRWEPNYWRNNCSHVWVYVPGIKIDYEILSQHLPN